MKKPMEKYWPSIDEIKILSKDYNVIPVCREIIADKETPVSTFAKIGLNRKTSFLLESVEGGEKVARYSFIGIDPFLQFKANGQDYTLTGIIKEKGRMNPVEKLKNLIKKYRSYHPANLPRFSCGAVGYFSYDTVRLFENIPNKNPADSNSMDEINFNFYKTILAFDNRQHKLIIINNILVSKKDNIKQKYNQAVKELIKIERILRSSAPANKPVLKKELQHKLVSNFKKEDYVKSVDKIKEYIKAGDVFQVVLSQRFRTECRLKPFDIYRCLRIINPSPYMYFLKMDDSCIVGSSPELLVRVEDGVVETRPIAGSRPRGKTPAEDESLAKELLADEKERAEHIMLVDLGRNDLGRVCIKGSVAPEEIMKVEKYSHIMHIVSSVRGKLDKTFNAVDALFSCFPAGTLSGAPKIRAMEIIDELEPTQRNIYGGALGYIDFSGNLDTCIIIRTLVVKNNIITLQSGGGIVADSVPEKEYEESLNKAKALFKSIEMAEKLQNEL